MQRPCSSPSSALSPIWHQHCCSSQGSLTGIYSCMDWRGASRALRGCVLARVQPFERHSRGQRRIFLDRQGLASTHVDLLTHVGRVRRVVRESHATRRTGWLPRRPTGRVQPRTLQTREVGRVAGALVTSPRWDPLSTPHAGSWTEAPGSRFQALTAVMTTLNGPARSGYIRRLTPASFCQIFMQSCAPSRKPGVLTLSNFAVS